MAGVSSPLMAAAVSDSGALGSIAVGATDSAGAEQMIKEVKKLTAKPFNVNVFCHAPAVANLRLESEWNACLGPRFKAYDTDPPENLDEIYKTFLENDKLLNVFLQLRPKVVSFHFGVPSKQFTARLRDAGIVLFASATNLSEARIAMDHGVDVVIAQGYEAGGHRGIFNPRGYDSQLGTLALTRILVKRCNVPVVAAGGIMDGAGIAAVLRLGASAAQLGTAFVACSESLADEQYKQALMSEAAHDTRMTRVISGRPARTLHNLFTSFEETSVRSDTQVPDYPIAYAAGKALHAAAKAQGEGGYGAQWAGQGAPLARRGVSAADLVSELVTEMQQAQEF